MPDVKFCELKHRNNSCLLSPLSSAEGREHLTPIENAWLVHLERGLERLEIEVRQRRSLDRSMEVT